MREDSNQNQRLIKELETLLGNHRHLFKQERVYQKVVVLVIAELFKFGRGTMTQLLLVLGLNMCQWSSWYRVFSKNRFPVTKAQAQLFKETLKHSDQDAPYGVGEDGTQTWRTGKKIEGVGWLKNARTPPFRIGIHRTQRWFNGVWFTPPEKGYSRVIPLQWMPAFTEKSRRKQTPARKEWEAAVLFLKWVRQNLNQAGRSTQQVLMLADGSYDTIPLWNQLPETVSLLARSAKNRALYHPLTETEQKDKRRKYGQRALTPQGYWRLRTGWRKLTVTIRMRDRQLTYRVQGPFFRRGAPQTPLFLLIFRGHTYYKRGRKRKILPMPYLVNARIDEAGQPVLPSDRCPHTYFLGLATLGD